MRRTRRQPTPIDWDAVRRRLAERNIILERAFAGEGPWAEALFQRRTEEMARQTALPLDDRRLGQSLLVAAGTRLRYGLELERLGRVLPLPRVAPIPGAATDLLGLIAVNGRVVRLFDADILCGEPSKPNRGDGYAVILRGGRRPMALRFLTVEDVAEYRDTQTIPKAGRTCPYISAVTPDRVAILDVPAILERAEGSTEL